MNTKLYYHKTDGGAEYLCTSPVEGTDEGDLYTTIIRLDGEPELMNPAIAAWPELLDALYVAERRILQLCETVNTLAGFRKVRVSDFAEEVRAAIAKATGE